MDSRAKPDSVNRISDSVEARATSRKSLRSISFSVINRPNRSPASAPDTATIIVAVSATRTRCLTVGIFG
jgi:archaellum component FlaG (FlaF/FlaG flagellin family)